MSALPVYHQPIEELESPEVIYLVVPPSVPYLAPKAKPLSMAERFSVVLFNLQNRSKVKSDRGHALAFAISFTMLTGLWAYNVKSAFGVNIFPHQHIESFVPVAGWQR